MPRARNSIHKWNPKPGTIKPAVRKPRHHARLSERQQERIRTGNEKSVRLGVLTTAQLDRSQRQAPLTVIRKTPTGKVLYTAHYNPKGKLVKVQYAKNAPETIAERAKSKTRRESEKGKKTLIKNTAKRETKKMEKEKEAMAQGHNLEDAKSKQKRRIREQTVGLALKNVGITDRELIANIHNLYSKMKEYDFRREGTRISKIPKSSEKTFAREEMQRLLGDKWHPFRRERNRIAQKIRYKIAKLEQARKIQKNA